MNILITGSGGFVGGFLKKKLEKNYNIFSPRSSDLDLRNLELVKQWFDQNKIDIVIHCALSGRETLESLDNQYLTDGLLMFRNLWLNQHKFKKLIHLGTAYELNLKQDNIEIKENEFLNHLPVSSYGYSKNIIARIIKETNNFYNLRIFGNFHETESTKRFFKRVINDPMIIIENDIYMDYIYIEDILPIIDYLINKDHYYRDINLVYKDKYRLSDLAYMICDYLKLNKNKIQIVNKGTNNLTGNSLRFAEFNFNLIGLEQGIRNYK